MSKKRLAANLRLKRAYDEAAPEDGMRILVDRIWPRGVKKEAAAIDRWMKELAPSTDLRKWFGHDPERWTEFQRRYKLELRQHSETLEELKKLARNGPVTLVFGARDEEHNQAVALRDALLS